MNFSKRNFVIFSLILLLVTPTIGVLAQQEGSSQQSTQQKQPTVVATVNGSDITRQELSQNTQVYPIIMTLSRQFRSFAQFLMTSEAGSEFLREYRKYVLDQLIEQELQKQKMEEMDIEVSQEDVQEQIDTIIQNNDQFEDEASLKEYLKENQNMSIENLKSRIKESLRQQELRAEVTDEVQVSEEEITSFYEENKQNYKDQEGNVKPLEDVKEQIEGTLKSQKSSEAWSEWLQNAKENAEIEKNLENI